MSVHTSRVISLILTIAFTITIMFSLPASAGISLAIGVGGLLIVMIWSDRQRRLRRETNDETSPDPGYSVEVDCRACGQFNRVPSHRLRDRPKCGRCKARLMPGKQVVVCRVFSMERDMRDEVNALWKDEDRLWQCLADHIALKAKAKAEEQNPQSRVMN